MMGSSPSSVPNNQPYPKPNFADSQHQKKIKKSIQHTSRALQPELVEPKMYPNLLSDFPSRSADVSVLNNSSYQDTTNKDQLLSRILSADEFLNVSNHYLTSI